MSDSGNTRRAHEPEELAQLFLERANQGDVEGLVALYAPDAALALPDGNVARGTRAIREFYSRVLASRPHFEPGARQIPLRSEDLALTSTRLVNGNITAEIARRQADDTWLWVVDQPSIAKS